MSDISLIVATDQLRGIGKNQQLLCHLPEDLAFFKQQTMGKSMIMGRRTYQSIGRPLPGRRSIVLTTDKKPIPGVVIVHSIQEALALGNPDSELMIIGGATLYEQFLPLATRIYMTVIHHNFEADVFFPLFDEKLWSMRVLKVFAANAKNQYDMTFKYYEKILTTFPASAKRDWSV